jgi:hypothetical protein
MNIVLFIDLEYLKNNTPIEQNVDDDKLLPHLIDAQTARIMPLLGESFYRHLEDAIENSTLTADEELLLRRYIQPALADWAYYQAYPYLGIKTTNKGQSKENSEFSSNADLNEMKYIRQDIRDIAELKNIRLVSELKRGCNFGLYPLARVLYWDNPKKSSKASFGGIYLERKTGVKGMDTYDEPDC